MSGFIKYEIISLFLGIALMLGTARLMGELFRRFRLPAVVGEILAGILIGKTLLGKLAPGFYEWMFPIVTKSTVSLDALILLGVTFLLLIAGLELDLSSVWKQGRSVIWMSLFNMLCPFALGFSLAWLFPSLFGKTGGGFVFYLFMGIALSITALPIIAKILMDMNIFHSDFGMMVLTSALIIDLFGWLLFSVLIQLMETGAFSTLIILKTAGLTLAVSLLILTALRYLINRTLPWIQANTEWPGGVIGFIIILGLIFSALAEAIGLHAIFGAFLAGIAIGDSEHLREHTREVINQFISNIFAPLFFVSIGLRIDFVQSFNPLLVLILLMIAFAGKIGGSLLAGRISGMRLRESLSVGSAMSASGTMQIILGLTAMEFKVINNEIFVAIVIMAVVTTVMSTPLMKLFMEMKKTRDLASLIESRLFIPGLRAKTALEAIEEMSVSAALKTGIAADTITRMVQEREMIMSTGIGNGIAVPHARIRGLKSPCLAVGISRMGIDFNAPDGIPAALIFLILTPFEDSDSQLQILAEISRIFIQDTIREEALGVNTYSEFLTLIKIAAYGGAKA